jgi:hypothetical protein
MKYIEITPGYNLYYQEHTSVFDDDRVLNMIFRNLNLYKITSTKEKTVAGIQTPLIIKCDEFLDILNKSDELCSDIIKEKKPNIIGKISNSWIYFKNVNDKYQYSKNDGFHTHSSSMYVFNNDLTWTYYFQIPNNCNGNEGTLRFKIDDKIFYIPVKEKTFYIFDANWLHAPAIAPNSTKDRIVFAGNYHFIENNNDIKKAKTLL